MLHGEFTALGRCYMCRQVFRFDPDRVPSVSIDPVTRKPPDVDGEPDGAERARREPLCRPCVMTLNIKRKQRGLEPIDAVSGYFDERGEE